MADDGSLFGGNASVQVYLQSSEQVEDLVAATPRLVEVEIHLARVVVCHSDCFALLVFGPA